MPDNSASITASTQVSKLMDSQNTRKSAAEITDIQSDHDGTSLAKDLQESLRSNPPSLPSLLLWNEQGLKHFEAVTFAPQYYLTGCEIELLQKHSDELAMLIEPGAVILELGSGNLRKIKILLEALEKRQMPVDYYALDLSKAELERTLEAVRPGTFKYVQCHGLLGTYDNALEWLKKFDVASRPRVILSLGSTLGSFTRKECAEFLGRFVDMLNHSVNGADKSENLVVIGLDGCKDGNKVWRAYNDEDQKNDHFIKNSLNHANLVINEPVFNEDDWERHGEWNGPAGRHEQHLVPRNNVQLGRRQVTAGEKLFVVASHKYGVEDREKLWLHSGLSEIRGWQTQEDDYGLYALSTR